MKVKDLTVFFLLISTICFSSCRKGETLPLNIPTTIRLQTLHHELIIPECEVYVQYFADQNEFPGFENYAGFDTVYYTDDFGKLTIKDLPLGTHWLYGRGYDDEIREGVKGLIKVSLDIRTLEVDTILYVGEE